MNKSIYFIAGALVGLAFVALVAKAATTVLPTFSGGTGTSSPSGLLYGDNNATNHVNTVTIGSGLTFSAGTLSASGGAGSYPFQGAGNSTSTLTQFNNGLTAYATSTIGNGTVAGGLTVNGTATTTNFVNSNITSALALFDANHKEGAYGGSSNPCASNQAPTTLSAVGALGACTASLVPQTRALNTTFPLQGGCTLAGDCTFTTAFGTTTDTGLPRNMILASNASGVIVASSTPTFAAISATSTATSTIAGPVTIKGVVTPTYKTPGFTLYATTTPPAFSGTTTIALPSPIVNQTIDTIGCYTDVGTVWVDIYHTSTHLTLLSGSTTQGIMHFTTSNTMTAYEKWFVDVGTPASSPTRITCVFQLENTQ
jgi:hypothetical protein